MICFSASVVTLISFFGYEPSKRSLDVVVESCEPQRLKLNKGIGPHGETIDREDISAIKTTLSNNERQDINLTRARFVVSRVHHEHNHYSGLRTSLIKTDYTNYINVPIDSLPKVGDELKFDLNERLSANNEKRVFIKFHLTGELATPTPSTLTLSGRLIFDASRKAEGDDTRNTEIKGQVINLVLASSASKEVLATTNTGH